MNTVKDSRFVDSTVSLDATEFTGCTFTRCVMVFSGGALPKLTDCEFIDTAFRFAGAGARPLQLLQAMYQGGLHLPVDQVIDQIRGATAGPQFATPPPSEPPAATGAVE